ncbi:MAG: histidine phosphotransferase ChpT [Flavobacteriaceae bacterium]
MNEEAAAGRLPDKLELAALLCSKLCHDIISPVGAVNNGIEVLEDEKSADMRDFALELIAKSARQASAKLQFARIAYGAASSAGAEIDIWDAANVLRGFVESDGKIALDFDAPKALMAKNAVKLLFNLSMIAMNAIPKGGKLTVSVDPTSLTMELRATGTNPRVAAGVAEIASGNLDGQSIDAHNIQPYYTSLMAAETGVSVGFELGEESVTIRTSGTAS